MADFEPILEIYEPSGPIEKQFLPWHHPRKHYVRLRQWCETISRVLDESNRTADSIKYFGLPGPDLLDLRSIYKIVCQPRNFKLQAYALNTKLNEQGSTDIISDKFRLESNDHITVQYNSDGFNTIASKRSDCYRKFHEFGFYDVVNLDFCDGFASGNPAQKPNNFEAIKSVIDHQCHLGDRDWVLFLTTLVGVEHCHKDVFNVFEKLISVNQANCEGFTDAWEVLLHPGDLGYLEINKVVNAVGILKWVAQQLGQWQGWDLVLTDVCSYAVHKDSGEDLVSFSLRFIHKEAETLDPTNLVSLTPRKFSECLFSKRSARRIYHRKNVDRLLDQDHGLRAEMLRLKADLLEEAGYDKGLFYLRYGDAPDFLS